MSKTEMKKSSPETRSFPSLILIKLSKLKDGQALSRRAWSWLHLLFLGYTLETSANDCAPRSYLCADICAVTYIFAIFHGRTHLLLCHRPSIASPPYRNPKQ